MSLSKSLSDSLRSARARSSSLSNELLALPPVCQRASSDSGTACSEAMHSEPEPEARTRSRPAGALLDSREVPGDAVQLLLGLAVLGALCRRDLHAQLHEPRHGAAARLEKHAVDHQPFPVLLWRCKAVLPPVPALERLQVGHRREHDG
eukprot:3937209-Rhodomonas_salina.3